MLACFPSLYIALHCRPSICWMPPCLCLSAPGLCVVAKHALLLPAFDLGKEKGWKWKGKKKKKGEERQTADLKHFQLLQDQIFMQGMIGWQHNHLLYCTFVWGQKGDVSQVVTRHIFNNHVKQIWLHTLHKDCPEMCAFSETKKKNYFKSIASVCFWIKHDSPDQFPQQNQLWQEWEWKLLNPHKGGQGPRKGQNATLPPSIRLFCPGSWSNRAGRSYSNSSWKCLIRASPSSLRQSTVWGSSYGKTALASIQESTQEKQNREAAW